MSAVWKRRTFLQSAGAVIPAVECLESAAVDSAKFTPIDLNPFFNSSSAQFGPRAQAKYWADPPTRKDGLLRTPSGDLAISGMPFHLGPAGVDANSRVVLGANASRSVASFVEIPLAKKASYLCLAQYCDWEGDPSQPLDVDAPPSVGQRLAEAVLTYDDGTKESFPIRRRFETSPPARYVEVCYCALPSSSWAPGSVAAALPSGEAWGDAQMALSRIEASDARIWIWPLENPHPDRVVKSLRIQAASSSLLVLCGLTLFQGSGNPLQRQRRSLLQITLPTTATDLARWQVDVDLGVVARTYMALAPDAGWLANETGAALGDKGSPFRPASLFYAEISASPAATLTLRDKQTGATHCFEFKDLLSATEAGTSAPPRIEWIERDKVWLHGRIIDKATGAPTPARIAFRSASGRYIPPYGHRSEINTGFFQDYGADLKLGESSFAYVDGTFQVELPVGDVYVEISKGFEYRPVRSKLKIERSSRQLDLPVEREFNLRQQGWVTADTHVHFLAPSTALLEAQAEGLNLVNLLAAQWGDLFTNVGDISLDPMVSRDRESMVWIGTENRQHLLGHIGLLGTQGRPVFPLSADGPNEGYLADPLWNTMAEWSDACREREGLAVGVHFPQPLGELPADIVMGKIDAVELYPSVDSAFRTLGYQDWYRYLNCGYRLSVTGGTDKMSATMPVGANRTYAFIGQEEFTFANWAKAVRGGKSFATTGPLLFLQADGHVPGDDLKLSNSGGTVEVRIEASSFVPFHRVELIQNGRVVASREEAGGTLRLTMTEAVRIKGACWLAARCSSRFGSTTAARFGIAAHTSPIYVHVPGEELFSAPAMTYMLSLIEGARAYVDKYAIRAGEQRHQQILQFFDQARAKAHTRLHQHGVSHDHG